MVLKLMTEKIAGTIVILHLLVRHEPLNLNCVFCFQILEKVESGERLSRPARCPREFYKLMLHCWAIDPTQRPTFAGTFYSDLFTILFHMLFGCKIILQ